MPDRASLFSAAKTFVSFGIVTNIVAGGCLYVYLQEIGWPELLSAALASNTGIYLIVAAFSVVLLLMMALMYSSAFIVRGVADTYSQTDDMLPASILYVAAWHLAWTMFVVIWILSESSETSRFLPGWIEHIHGVWPLLLFGASETILAGVFRALWRRRSPFPLPTNRRPGAPRPNATASIGATSLAVKQPNRMILVWKYIVALSTILRPHWNHFLSGAVAGSFIFIASVVSSMGAIDVVLSSRELRDAPLLWQPLTVLTISMRPGQLAGMAYLAHLRSTGDSQRSFRVALGLSLIVAIWGISVAPTIFLRPVELLSLGAMSIYSDVPRHYVLMKPEMTKVYSRAGFSFEDNDPPIFTGFDRFRLGEVLVVCISPYQPFGGRSTPQSAEAKHGCVLAGKDELRRIDPA